MSGSNVNCFEECLHSLDHGSDDPSITKHRKGIKCLTLVRNGKNFQNASKTETNQSTGIEITQLPARHIQQQVQTPNPFVNKPIVIERERPIHNPHIIFGRYSVASVNPQITNHLYLPLHASFQKERRLSETHADFYHRNQVTERSNSLEHSKVLIERKVPIVKIQPFREQNHNFISVIRQEMENERRSSLFQGAKSILSKIVSSNKNTARRETQQPVPQTVQKTSNFEIRNFYDNARLCQTQHAINNTHSTIKTEHYQQPSNLYLSRQLSIDAIPMSPKSKSLSKYKNIKIGKLLGVGKWAHTYLCQQAKTNLIYSFKEIFKQSLQYPVTVELIHSNVKQLMAITHPKIVSIYSKFQTPDKICLILEYCTRSIYEELKHKGQLSIGQIQAYISDIIEGVVYLHENDLVHGNINIFSTYLNFSECKLRPCITETDDGSSKTLNFKEDINSIAILLHEMAYGITPNVASEQTLYEKEKYYKEKKRFIVNQIGLHNLETKSDYIHLNSFITMLLNWNSEVRLTAGVCYSHPFLKDLSRL